MALVCFLALQLYFASRIGLMKVVNPQSTTFQRSERLRLWRDSVPTDWKQEWVPYEKLSTSLKRAVIASEDAGFAEHSGVDWDALEKAWERNQQVQVQRDKKSSQSAMAARASNPRKMVGGSTISQQLAKNLFLSSERNMVRKLQELIITFMLEHMLGKQRMLEIYLNNVEWGEGIFGAQAAGIFYFGTPAHALNTSQSARLAVMLPAPKRFQKRPHSAYLSNRSATIAARMNGVDLP